MSKFRFGKTANIVNSRGYTAAFRKRTATGKRKVIATIAVIAGFVLAPVGVHAVQNIFTGFGQVTDIQFGGANIDQVVYQGETIWERNRVPAMQTLASCSSDRTMARDARDNKTYWIQRVGDLCWMETNLAYAGGGDNTYGDVKNLSEGSAATSYTDAHYYVPSGANPTSGDVPPSTSTNGIGQYGYLYNWCGAMGGQVGTSACLNATSPSANALESICPAGWRLPTGNGSSPTNEFQDLFSALGVTANAAGSTILRNDWLGMYGGSYRNNGDGFSNQGVGGAYWSSTQHPSDTINAWAMYLYSNTTYPGTGTGDKAGALTVRYVKDMPAQTGDDIQTITAANCPVDRTRARDARDGATYWVRKIGSLCWMETNLAYAGGGTNTYGDATSAITQGSSSADLTDTEARYFVPTGSNRTTGTTDPSTSTNGTGQYGYLYNWCAAMNSQSAACQITSSDQPNQSVNSGTASTLYNICPLNWRLPAGGSGGEFAALNSAINSGSTSSWSRLLTQGLFMYSGVWSDDFKFQGSTGYYWSSTAYPSRATHAYTLNFGASGVYPAISVTKRSGFAVRCVAP